MQYPKQTDNYDVDIFNSNFRELAGNVISLDTTKFDKTEAQGLFKDVSFNRSNGVITFILYDGSTKTIDTLLEKLAVNFDFDRETQRLIITLDDGTEKYVDLSAFITQYEFLDSETIAFVLGEDGKVSAKIKEGSIEEKHLRPNYLADIKTEAAKAEAARQSAQESQRETEEAEANAVASAAASVENANSARTAAEEALEAKTKAQKAAVDAESYAHGGTGTREGEDQDNAAFYCQQSKALHNDILAATEATEENAGLMSAHDKSWADGRFRRYVYGANRSGDADNGYYKIASVETNTTYRTFGLVLRIWSDNFTNFKSPPIETTIYFRTNNNNVPSSVFVYIDGNTGVSSFYKDGYIFIKHSKNAETAVPNGTEKCEIYFYRHNPYSELAFDVLGEIQRNVTSSEENYQNVWTFYDGTEIYDSIEEEGYEVGALIHYADPTSNVGNNSTPIYLEKGMLKTCSDLPIIRKYVYGKTNLGKGFYKVASIKTDVNHGYTLKMCVLPENTRWDNSRPREFVLKFVALPAAAGNQGVYIYKSSDISLAKNMEILNELYLKYQDETEGPLVEIYWEKADQSFITPIEISIYSEIAMSGDGEVSDNHWTFYNDGIISESITEDGYIVKNFQAIFGKGGIGSTSQPIYVTSEGFAAVCTKLPTGTTDYNDLENKPSIAGTVLSGDTQLDYSDLKNIPSINGVPVTGAKTPEAFKLVKFTDSVNLGLENTANAIGYVSGTTPIYNIADGAIFEQAYSNAWCQQIYGDYRTGQIATRGKNNGVWQAWRRQLDQYNYVNYIKIFDARVHNQVANIGGNKYIKIMISREALNGAGFMGSFTVRIYQNYIATDYLVSGYNYRQDPNGNYWLYPKVAILGSTDPSYPNGTEPYVYFGYDADYLWVMFEIGNYSGASVFGINSGYYSLNDNLNIGRIFSITFTGSITGTTVARLRPKYPVLNGMASFRVGQYGMIREGTDGYASIDFVANGYIEANSNIIPQFVRLHGFAPVEGGGGEFIPGNNGGINLGSSSYRWKNIYSTTAVNVSSDSREKIDQKPLDEELTEKFVLGLEPKSYKRIDGTSNRRHHGLIAQEVEELMDALEMSSLDFAGFIKSPITEPEEYEDPETGEKRTIEVPVEGEYAYSLRYEEFIPMLIKMIQRQHSRIKVLENENLQLSERLARIEDYLELV